MAIRVRAYERRPVVEAAQRERRDVLVRRSAVKDPVGDRGTDRRRGLEAGAGEAAQKDEAVRPGTVDDRPLVGRHPVLAWEGAAHAPTGHPGQARTDPRDELGSGLGVDGAVGPVGGAPELV